MAFLKCLSVTTVYLFHIIFFKKLTLKICARLIGFYILVFVKNVKFKKYRVGLFLFLLSIALFRMGGKLHTSLLHIHWSEYLQYRKAVKFLGLVRKTVFV